MKCVYAEWEQRNLGFRTVELTIEKKDALLSEKEISQCIENYKQEFQAQYLVIKVSTKYPYISQYLQKQGFLLIESQIGLKLNRENVLEAYEKYKDIFPDVTYEPADRSKLEYVTEEIEKGIFLTDRIALDPHFNSKIANRRYALWIKDEYENSGNLFLSYHQGRPMGFFFDKEYIKGEIHGLLGGLFLRDDNLNCGSMHIFAGRKAFLERGLFQEKTSVSANNLQILQLQLMFGSKISNISNVFIKHIDYN